MLHDNYLCLVESNKQKIEEVRSKIQEKISETKATPKRVWICPIAPPSLSRDRRIKMKKSEINSLTNSNFYFGFTSYFRTKNFRLNTAF